MKQILIPIISVLAIGSIALGGIAYRNTIVETEVNGVSISVTPSPIPTDTPIPSQTPTPIPTIKVAPTIQIKPSPTVSQPTPTGENKQEGDTIKAGNTSHCRNVEVENSSGKSTTKIVCD